MKMRRKGGAAADPTLAKKIKELQKPLRGPLLESRAAHENASAELEAKTSAYKTAKELFYNPRGNLIRKDQFEAAENAFKSAQRSLATATERLKLLEQQMQDIEVGEEEIQLLQKDQRKELENKLAAQRKMETANDLLRAKEKERQRLEPLKLEWDGLHEDITRAKDQVKTFTSRMSMLDAVLRNVGDELRITSPATPSLFPNSDRNKKMALGFMIPLLIGLGLMVAVEMTTKVWRAETLAERLQLSVLAHSSRGTGGTNSPGSLSANESRTLGLRIRQFVPGNGGAVLIDSLNDANGIDRLIVDLSRSFAVKGEQILILDARIANAQAECLPALIDRRADGRPIEVVSTEDVAAGEQAEGAGLAGLAQYLVFEGQHSANFIYRTRLHGVDYMPSGGPYPITDALASEPMAELVKVLRQSYTLILIVGPAVSRSVDTEILAAFVDGIIVVLNEPLGRFSSADEEFFRSLREKNAPLLGSVICV